MATDQLVDIKRVEAKLGVLLLQIIGYEQALDTLSQQLAIALAEIATLKQGREGVRAFPAAVETDATG